MLALRNDKQDDQEFKASLGYVETPSQQTNQRRKKEKFGHGSGSITSVHEVLGSMPNTKNFFLM